MDRRASLARTAWRTLSTRSIYANPWIRVREDSAELPDGRTTIYGVVECKPCTGVLPFLDSDTVVLVGHTGTSRAVSTGRCRRERSTRAKRRKPPCSAS